jgi:hypothetical protein
MNAPDSLASRTLAGSGSGDEEACDPATERLLNL